MNNFKISFKENIILEINGTKKTYKAGTTYGFKYVSDKDLKNIRRTLIKSKTADFILTDDLLGCSEIVYGNKTSNDRVTENLVTLNKGKKNKGKTIAKPKSLEKKKEEVGVGEPEETSEPSDGIVPPIEESVTIDTESEGGSNE